MEAFRRVLVRSGGISLALAGGLFLFLFLMSIGSWWGGISSSLVWPRRSSSKLLEVCMFSSSKALELSGTAISPSDISRFSDMGWSGKTVV